MGNKFFAELSRRLNADGIESCGIEDKRLEVFLHSQPVLYVSPASDVFLLPAGSQNEEASELYHQVAMAADEVYSYVEPGDEFKEVYRRGEIAPYFDHSGAPVVLEVSKGYFDDPGYDNDKTAILNLPATDAAIWRAVEAVDAASEEECAFRCTDCLLPSLRDAINDAIDEEGGIGQINEFAQLLAQKNQIWDANDLVKYKALLSVAGHPSLQDAMQLMHGLDAYELRPEVAQTWEYAEAALREKYPDLPEVLFQTPQAGQVGRELLERDHAVITDYGLLRRKDGGQLPVFQPEQQENEITGPAFAGM